MKRRESKDGLKGSEKSDFVAGKQGDGIANGAVSFEEDVRRRIEEARVTLREAELAVEQLAKEQAKKRAQPTLADLDRLRAEVARLEQVVGNREQQIRNLVAVLEAVAKDVIQMGLFLDMNGMLYWSANNVAPMLGTARKRLDETRGFIMTAFDDILKATGVRESSGQQSEEPPYEFLPCDGPSV